MMLWITQRKVNPNTDLQDMACMRWRLQESRERNTKNRMKGVRGTAKAGRVGAGKSELKVGQQKGSRFFSGFISGDCGVFMRGFIN